MLAPLPSRGTSMASGWPVFSEGRPATSFFGSATTTTTTSADTTALRPGSCDDRLSSWLPGGSCWSEAKAHSPRPSALTAPSFCPSLRIAT